MLKFAETASIGTPTLSLKGTSAISPAGISGPMNATICVPSIDPVCKYTYIAVCITMERLLC